MFIILLLLIFPTRGIHSTKTARSLVCEETVPYEQLEKASNFVEIYLDDKSNNDNCSVKSNCASDGLGIFRDPIEILGIKYQSSNMIFLCEIHMRQQSDAIVERQFTKNGTRTCLNVCCQYRCRMMTDGPVDIKLTEAYCGFVDEDDAQGSSTGVDIGSMCSCVYRMECNQRTKMLMFNFESNCDGYVRVTKPGTSERTRFVT